MTNPMLNPNLLLWVPLAPLIGCILAGFFGKPSAAAARTW